MFGSGSKVLGSSGLRTEGIVSSDVLSQLVYLRYGILIESVVKINEIKIFLEYSIYKLE